MDPPPLPGSSFTEQPSSQATVPSQNQSFSQKSDDSHTAAEYVLCGVADSPLSVY